MQNEYSETTCDLKTQNNQKFQICACEWLTGKTVLALFWGDESDVKFELSTFDDVAQINLNFEKNRSN